jgi:hypothetical protein
MHVQEENGEKNLAILLTNMNPVLNEGNYVFSTITNLDNIKKEEILFFFRERESITVALRKEVADAYHLVYGTIMSWITLTVHSSLDAVGLTAAFSAILAKEHISCNVVAGYYHDHIFVAQKDAQKSINALKILTTAKSQP